MQRKRAKATENFFETRYYKEVKRKTKSTELLNKNFKQVIFHTECHQHNFKNKFLHPY